MQRFIFNPIHSRTAVLPLLLSLGLALLLLSNSGCKSGNPFKKKPSLPVGTAPAIASNASASEIISIVNQNVSRIDSFYTKNATLNGEGVFNLKGEIAFKRPGNFRLLGSHAVTGMELDVGRNPEVMWMWVGKAEPKAMYYCSNADYARCESELNLSINPAWVIDAMGFGILNPQVQYEGPIPVPEDEKHVELRIQETSASGEPRTKCIIVNREYGMPAAIRIYDRFKSLVADARVKSFTRHSETGLIIPQSVEINCPKENQGKGMKFTIHYGSPALNQLDASNPHLWAMPQYPGYPPTNMAQ